MFVYFFLLLCMTLALYVWRLNRSSQPSPAEAVRMECRAIAKVHGAGPSTTPGAVTVYVPEDQIIGYMGANRSRVLVSAPATGNDLGYYVTVTR